MEKWNKLAKTLHPCTKKSKKIKTIFGDKGDVLTKFWPKNDPKLLSQGDKEFTMSRRQRHQGNLLIV